MNNRSTLIGIDIGGTKMHFARVESGVVVAEERIPTDACRPNEEIVADVVKGIRSVLTDQVSAIGIGIPGLVDMHEGVIKKLNNIPCWNGFAIKEALEKELNIPVFIGNDANCFALGEKHFGKGKEAASLVCLTLGSGVGAGVVIDHKLHEGNCMMAGEFGGIKYMTADYEVYCGGKFFATFHGKTALEMSQAAATGDEKALAAFAEFGDHVGNLIQAIIYSYGPDTIIMGGSLLKSYAFFRDAMNANLAAFAHPHVIEATRIDVSDDPHMPVLGAAAVALEMA